MLEKPSDKLVNIQFKMSYPAAPRFFIAYNNIITYHLRNTMIGYGNLLRVQHLNFDTGIMTINDGKGKKNRTVPIPQVLVPELQKQVEHVNTVYLEDLKSGYDGTFLFGQLE